MSEIKCSIIEDDIGDISQVKIQLMSGFEVAARKEISDFENFVKSFPSSVRDEVMDIPDPDCSDKLRMVRESIESGEVTCRECGRAYSRLPEYHPGDDLQNYWAGLRKFKYDLEDVYYTWGTGCACRPCIDGILDRSSPDDLL